MFFKNLTEDPNDPILGLDLQFKSDKNIKKVNLGVGVYNDNDSNISILNSVKKAEEILLNTESTKNYLQITGNDLYNRLTKNLYFGENNSLVKEGLIQTSQTIGGTGALRIAGEFLKNEISLKIIWIPNPTWSNHIAIFKKLGFEIKYYTYYDPKTKSLDWNKTLEDFKVVQKGDIILLHGCCHNPTGVDFSKEQWNILADLLLKKEAFPLFDVAYLGFATSIKEDSYSFNLFANKGFEMIVCTSFSKNFGLYNERIGAIHVIGKTQQSTFAASTKIRTIIRVIYSNPSNHGAAIVAKILSNDSLKSEWESEVNSMCLRIKLMRQKLYEGLLKYGYNFDFIIKQNGMFSFMGLTPNQIQSLIEDYSIYAVSNSRFNIAGLTSHNIDYVVDSIATVLKKHN